MLRPDKTNSLPNMESRKIILGLALNGQARAYPYELLGEQPLINDTVGGTPVLIVFSEKKPAALVYERYVGTSVELTFHRAPGEGNKEQIIIDQESGSQWDELSGEAISGPWKGHVLERLPSTSGSWFLWHDIYPHSDIYHLE